MMKLVIKKKGSLKDLKEIISGLCNFTGFIKLNDYKLFYRNSELIYSTYKGNNVDVKTILRNLGEYFEIQLFKCDDDVIDDIIQLEIRGSLDDNINKKYGSEFYSSKTAYVDDYTNNTNNKDNFNKNNKNNKNNIGNFNGINNNIFNNIKTENLLEFIKYDDIKEYIGTGIYKVELISKKYKEDKGILIFKNGEEFASVYFSTKSGKLLFGKKALGKIKTMFAVSVVYGMIDKISSHKLNEFIEKYPDSILKIVVSLNKLIENIKNRNYKEITNDALSNILTKKPSFIEIDSNKMYIVSKDNEVKYAFYKDYDGDKSYRHIKNYCIFNSVVFKIYPISEEEYKLFREYRNNKVKND